MGLRDSANEDRNVQTQGPDIPRVTPPNIPNISEERPEEKSARTGDAYPKRYWTAGPGTPQVKLIPVDTGTNGKRRVQQRVAPLKPRNYYYVVNTPEEEKHLLNSSMRRRVWLEDLDEDETNLLCEECNFSCRSKDAFIAHLGTHRRGSNYLGQIRATRNPASLG